MKVLLLMTCAMLMSTSIQSKQNDFEPVEKLLQKALKSKLRTSKDKVRDSNRLPIQTLKFFGLKTNMKVIELLPGNGWYSKLLAPVLADNGEFAVALGTKRVSDNLLGEEGMEFITLIDPDANIHRKDGDKLFSMDEFDLGQRDVDIVFTFRNYHNFNYQARMRMNRAVFRALKPGGVYAMVDHTRRHMEEFNSENRRRIDPVLAIKEAQDSGFIFEDYSDLHHRTADQLLYEVGKEGVTGNTDRFTIKFVKPK